MGNSIRVLMFGSTTKVKGGMTTVVKSFLHHQFSPQITLVFIPSHSEKGRIFNSFFFVKSLGNFIIQLLFKHPDIIHLHMSDKGSFIRKFILFRMSRLFSKPVIVHAHGGDFQAFYSRLPEILKLCVRDMLKNSEKVIALGKNWDIIIREIEPQTDVLVLKNSVPIPTYTVTSEMGSFNILFLAVLNESKGILDLIDAAEKILSTMNAKNKDLIFNIAGDGEMLQISKERVKIKKLDSYFKFHGWVDQERKLKLLKQADLFVLPSYYEGLPMSILEAVSYGVPVIATDVGSIDEAVIDGVNGFLIKPGDIEALASRISAMMENPNLHEMRNASRLIAVKNFNEETYFRKMEELYLNCLPDQNLFYDRKKI